MLYIYGKVFQKGDFSDLVEFMVAIFKGNIGPISNDVTAWYPIVDDDVCSNKKKKQAGAELCQAQTSLDKLWFVGKKCLMKKKY